MTQLAPLTVQNFFDNTGAFLVGGKLFVYLAGTATKSPAYVDNTGATAFTNPIIMNARGEPENGSGASNAIWLNTGLAYKFVLAPATDTDPPTSPFWAVDNIVPGGPSGVQLDTIAQLNAADILSTVNALTLTGYYAAADGGGGLYVRGGTSGHPGVYSSADGAHWTLSSAISGNSSKTFGAKADAVTNYTTYVTTGTDDTVALQEGVNFNAYLLFGSPLVLGQGTSLISDTLSLGYGASFQTAILSGLNAAFDNNAAFAGSGISVNFSDRPILAVQGGRNTAISHVQLVGPYGIYVVSNGLATAASPTIDDTLASNWIDSSLNANQNSRYAPFAGIAIDPYCGTAPSPAYPNVTFPSWTGITTQYGKSFSSRTTIEDVLITGVNTALVMTPSNVTGNGDYTEWTHGWVNNCMWGLSSCQTQSRSVVADFMQFAGVFCCLTNIQNGTQNGMLQSVFKNWSLGGVIKLFHVNSGESAGTLTWDQLYFEAFYKFGEIVSGGVATAPIVIRQSFGSFDLQTTDRGIPAAMLNSTNGPSYDMAQPFIIDGGGLAAFWSVLPLMCTGVKLTGYVNLYANQRLGSLTHASTCLAGNALAGGLVVPNFAANGVAHEISFPICDADLISITGVVQLGPYYSQGSRNHCIPLYATTVIPRLGDTQDAFYNPQVARVIPWQGLQSSLAYNQATGAMTYTDVRTQDQIETYGGTVGDVVMEVASNTIAFISGVTYATHASVSAAGQNNLYTGSTSCSEVLSLPGSPTLVILNSRIYAPAYPVTATSTAGSATLSCSLEGWGNANETPVAGDRVFFSASNNPFGLTPTTCKLATVGSVSGGVATLTLAGNATISATARIIFIRQPPAS